MSYLLSLCKWKGKVSIVKNSFYLIFCATTTFSTYLMINLVRELKFTQRSLRRKGRGKSEINQR